MKPKGAERVAKKGEVVPAVLVLTDRGSAKELGAETATMLDAFGVDSLAIETAGVLEAARRAARKAEKAGVRVVVVIAEGKSGMAGEVASATVLPVLAVPMAGAGGTSGRSARALRSLEQTAVCAKPGREVACLAVGVAGARNAALLAVSILALNDKELDKRLKVFRSKQTRAVLAVEIP